MRVDPCSPPSEQRYRSELFTVRLWRERLDDHWEWRGKVQHVVTGEIRYFRDWRVLLDFLQEVRTEAGIDRREDPLTKAQE